ncbi:MAG TPA: trehalose-phosphatase [Bryobacteraceae bacterium]|nr:trehalose-phosphatase [Bryobacteraceae bacterium]
MFRLLAQLIEEIKDRIQSADWVSLFLDFDGTLVPIAARPEEPRLDADTAEALKLIASQEFLTISIISGRAVEDLYSRIRVEGLIYAGNYGLEIFGRSLRFVEPLAWSRREQLETLCADLEETLLSVPGSLVEYKGLTASVHYRRADQADIPRIRAAVRAAVARQHGLFRVNAGRKVFEILPDTPWNKGTAARWINSHLNETPGLSIYIGDDTSDEAAFRELPDAITIKVGAAPVTCAHYQLPDPAAVHEFLFWLSARETSRTARP